MSQRNTIQGRAHFRAWRRIRRIRAIVPLCLLCLALWSCDSFDFYSLLNGTEDNDQSKGPLAISPVSVTVTVDTSCTFTASGGTPPYTFAMTSGIGTIDESTGIYHAPAVPSSDVVQATDSAGGMAEARVVTVQ